MRPVILLVEDDPDDVFFLKKAFERQRLDCDLKMVDDGQKAIGYLKGLGPYGDRAEYPMPTHVILDISLPKITGIDVLEWMRSQPAFQGYPVIILSGAAESDDVRRVGALGVDAMIKKSLSIAAMDEIARDIGRRWGIAQRRSCE